MTKKTTKKTKAITEILQEELVGIFERFCKELLSEQIKLNKSLNKKTVLLSQKTTYNKRNIIK